MDILNGLPKEDLDALRQSFLLDPEGLTLNEFVQCVGRYVRDDRISDPAGSLVSMFRTIDFDGDQKLTWDEFTTFAIDAHMRNTQQKPHEWVAKYTSSKTVETGDPITRITHLKHWGPGGKFVAFCKNKPFKVFSTRSLQLLKVAPAAAVGRGKPSACEWVASQNLFAAASSDEKIRFLDRDFVDRQILPMDSVAMHLEWCPRSDLLYAGMKNGKLCAVEVGRSSTDLLMGKVKRTHIVESFDAHTKPIMGFQLHPNRSQHVFTCSLDGAVKLVDVERGPLSREPVAQQIGVHSHGALALTYSSDHDYVCTVGYEAEAFCWAPGGGTLNRKISLLDHSNPHKGNFVGIHAVPNSPEVLTMDTKGYVKVWDLRTFKCTQTLLMGWSPEDTYQTTVQNASMCYANSHNLLVTAERHRLCMYEQDTEDKFPSEAVSIVLYNSTQRSFMTSCGRDLKLWDVTQGCLTSQYTNVTTADITALTIDEFGRRVYIGTQDGSLSCRIYHTCSVIYHHGEEARHTAEVVSMCYLSDKRQLYTTALDGSVLIHNDREKGRHALVLHPPRTDSVAETVLLSCSVSLSLFATATPSEVRLRDMANPRKPLANVPAPEGTNIVAVAFLGRKGSIVLSLDTGRFLIMSTRPMMTKLDTGLSDLSPTVLCRWANSAHVQFEAWQVRHAAMNYVAKRDRQRRDLRPGEAMPVDEAERLGHGDGADPGPSYFFTSGSRFPAASCLHYDQSSHILWTGDVKGRVTAWMLCKVFGHHNLHDLTYPVKLQRDGSLPDAVFLEQRGPCHTLDDQVPILRTWCAHSDEIRHLCVHEETGTIVTSGDDRRVLIWDCEGVLVAELSYAKHYPDYGLCKVPSQPDRERGRLGSIFQLGDVLCRMTRLSSFFFTQPSTQPVALVKLLKRMQVAEEHVRSSPVCGHPHDLPLQPSIRDIVQMAESECHALRACSPFAVPATLQDPLPAEPPVPEAQLSQLCIMLLDLLAPYAVPPPVPVAPRKPDRKADRRARGSQCQQSEASSRRESGISVQTQRAMRSHRAQRSHVPLRARLGIGECIPKAPATADEVGWWSVGCKSPNKNGGYLFQCSDAVNMPPGMRLRAARPAREQRPEVVEAQPAAALPLCVSVKRLAAGAVSCIATVALVSCAWHQAQAGPVQVLQAIAEGQSSRKVPTTVDVRRNKALDDILPQKVAATQVVSNAGVQEDVCLQGEWSAWGALPQESRDTLEVQVQESKSAVAFCAGNPGVAIEKAFQRKPRKRVTSAPPKTCRPPDAAAVLQRPMPGAARCPMPAPVACPPPQRPQTGLVGKRVRASYLHALSNGYVPPTATNAPSAHSAMLTPSYKERAAS